MIEESKVFEPYIWRPKVQPTTKRTTPEWCQNFLQWAIRSTRFRVLYWLLSTVDADARETV